MDQCDELVEQLAIGRHSRRYLGRAHRPVLVAVSRLEHGARQVAERAALECLFCLCKQLELLLREAARRVSVDDLEYRRRGALRGADHLLHVVGTRARIPAHRAHRRKPVQALEDLGQRHLAVVRFVEGLHEHAIQRLQGLLLAVGTQTLLHLRSRAY